MCWEQPLGRVLCSSPKVFPWLLPGGSRLCLEGTNPCPLQCEQPGQGTEHSPGISSFPQNHLKMIFSEVVLGILFPFPGPPKLDVPDLIFQLLNTERGNRDIYQGQSERGH